MLPQPGWDVALRAVCLVRLLAKGNDPERGPRGPAKRGIGQRRGCQDRAKNLLGHLRPATGSHLPLEDAALPFAVAPFASSPFAHPIPLSRHRASGDLFSGSLKKKPGAGSLPPGYRHPLHRGVIGLLPKHHPTRFSCLSNWTKVQPVRKSFTTDLAIAPLSTGKPLARSRALTPTHLYSPILAPFSRVCARRCCCQRLHSRDHVK